MEVSWPTAGSWSLFACACAAIVGWLLVKRHRSKQELQKKCDKAEADVAVAKEEYENASRNGTAADIHRAAQEYNLAKKAHLDLKKQLAALCVAAVFAGTFCGCATREVERIVRLDEHGRLVVPGDVVPDYPAGESRWWLMTPTGLVDMLPKEF